MPGWTDSAAWQGLRKSAFKVLEVTVAATDHGFCDGASHQRQDPYRVSIYDTSVFVLQSKKAAKWAFDAAASEKDLRKAMALAVPNASAQARQDAMR